MSLNVHKRLVICSLAFGVILMDLHAKEIKHSYRPEKGFVPNERIAIRVAEVILDEIYGAEAIAAQKPLTAKLVGDTWVVNGSMPANAKGGVATIEIEKQSAKILRVSHGK